MNTKVKYLNLIGLFIFCTGFQVWPGGNSWDISSLSSAESKLFVDYPNPTRTLKNDLPATESLSGTGATITVQQAMDSVFADYNNIQAAFVTLVSISDSDYALRGENRTIKMESSVPGGLSGGEARGKAKDGKMVGCDIVFKEEAYDSAKGFIALVTHEIGHCLGLAHPQETTESIMSYFKSSPDMIRLQADDKMAIVYSYPTDKEAAKEAATLGLSCSRSK